MAKSKKKKSLFRFSVIVPDPINRKPMVVTKYGNSAKKNPLASVQKNYGNGTISRLNKNTNKFRKVKKIGW